MFYKFQLNNLECICTRRPFGLLSEIHLHKVGIQYHYIYHYYYLLCVVIVSVWCDNSRALGAVLAAAPRASAGSVRPLAPLNAAE